MDVRDLAAVAEVADVIQLGARNMQNARCWPMAAPASRSCSSCRHSANLEELLLAADACSRRATLP